MNITSILPYIVVASLCLSLFYLFYRLFLHKDTNFKAVRFYLAGAVIISFILPFTNLSVNMDLPSVGTAEYFTVQPDLSSPRQAENIETSKPSEAILVNPEMEPPGEIQASAQSSGATIPWTKIIASIWLLGFAFLLIRLIKQIIVICTCYFRSEKERNNSSIIIRNSTFDHPFSFFNWIFIPDKIHSGQEMNDIIQHEMIHARQWHSADILIAEILKALMWFNPLIWMMKNSVQLVHEYLADEGALNKGLDKIFYQTLLVNQVAEGQLIPLSSRFNHSLIKKRIIMMSKTKSNQLSKLKLLGILPIIALLVLGIACAKTQEKQVLSEVNGEMTNDDIIAAIVPIKMNVLYLGVDNPVDVAVSGFKSENLEVELDNGRIQGSDGHYIVNPARAGEAVITVYSNGKKTGSVTFRVKSIPDPMARVGVKASGEITKNELLEAGGINAHVNVDFDIQFKALSFEMSTPDPSGYVVKGTSTTDRFSEKQIEIINSLIKDQKLYFEEIKAIGPDGAIRNLGPMIFTITE
jgi:beta-lactamase regulating signal transducer with metallopeptidase domain